MLKNSFAMMSGVLASGQPFLSDVWCKCTTSGKRNQAYGKSVGACGKDKGGPQYRQSTLEVALQKGGSLSVFVFHQFLVIFHPVENSNNL